MSIRKLEPLPTARLYKDDYSIDSFIMFDKGSRVSDSPILSGNLNDMTEGETQIDFNSSRKITKMKGNLYKESVDADNNVILIKI